MTREWQQTKYKSYVMPKEVYYQAIWAIRDLDRMENRLEELSFLDDDSCQEKLILSDRVENIYNAFDTVPNKYHECIMNDIEKKDMNIPDKGKMWKYWKQRFVYGVAKNLQMF